MKLVYFATQPQKQHSQPLLDAIRTELPTVDIELFTDLQSFHKWLQVPPRDFFAAYLIPHCAATLGDLVALKEYFTDRKIVLSLPDDTTESIALACQLNPRYILSSCEDHQMVLPVLKKLHTEKQRERQWLDTF